MATDILSTQAPTPRSRILRLPRALWLALGAASMAGAIAAAIEAAPMASHIGRGRRIIRVRFVEPSELRTCVAMATPPSWWLTVIATLANSVSFVKCSGRD